MESFKLGSSSGCSSVVKSVHEKATLKSLELLFIELLIKPFWVYSV